MWMKLDHVSQLLSGGFPRHRGRARVQQNKQTLKPETQEENSYTQNRQLKHSS